MDDNNIRSYRIKVAKTGHAITATKRHIKTPNILAEVYLCNEKMKAKLIMAADRLNELIDLFMQIHKDDQFNKTEVEEKQYSQLQCHKQTTC